MTAPRATPLSDGRVQLQRAADVVADRIRELIVSGELADGERLPRLDLLLDEFGISGPSMREALRMLESEGLITVQRGSVGGAIVHRPSYKAAAYTMALVLRSRDTEVADVAESLALLELNVRRPVRPTPRSEAHRRARPPEAEPDGGEPHRRRRADVHRGDDRVPRGADARLRSRHAGAGRPCHRCDLAGQRAAVGGGERRARDVRRP